MELPLDMVSYHSYLIVYLPDYKIWAHEIIDSSALLSSGAGEKRFSFGNIVLRTVSKAESYCQYWDMDILGLVVVPGRAFLRRLIDLTKGIKSAHHFVRLTKSVKVDLEIWRSFLDDFNGRSIFLSNVWTDSKKIGSNLILLF